MLSIDQRTAVGPLVRALQRRYQLTTQRIICDDFDHISELECSISKMDYFFNDLVKTSASSDAPTQIVGGVTKTRTGDDKEFDASDKPGGGSGVLPPQGRLNSSAEALDQTTATEPIGSISLADGRCRNSDTRSQPRSSSPIQRTESPLALTLSAMGLSEGGCDVPTTQNTPHFKIDFEHPKTEQPEMELNGKATKSTEKGKEARIEPSDVTEEHENGPGDPASEAPLADPLCRPVLDAHEQPGAACIEGQAEQSTETAESGQEGSSLETTTGVSPHPPTADLFAGLTDACIGDGGVRDLHAHEEPADTKLTESADDENQLLPGVQAPRECLSPRRQVTEVSTAGRLTDDVTLTDVTDVTVGVTCHPRTGAYTCQMGQSDVSDDGAGVQLGHGMPMKQVSMQEHAGMVQMQPDAACTHALVGLLAR